MRFRSVWIAGVLVVALGALPALAAPKASHGDGAKTVVQPAGQTFCTKTPMVSGNVTIPPGCYVISVLRNPNGTFLAFVSPSAHIPPGQLVRLNTPAGAKRMGRMFLVPVSGNTTFVPMNTAQVVTTNIVTTGPQITITPTGLSLPMPPITFNVHP